VNEASPAFERLLGYLRESRGFDFTGYKRASLVRRVDHRMSGLGVATLEDYQDYLEVHPEEFTHLFNTILINATEFFRDADAWEYLRTELLPGLLTQQNQGVIRVWSAGCASGQEAYSLAMLMADALGPEEFRQRVKIYATDVDEEALAYARTASYTERELRGLPPETRERYFEPNGARQSFRKEFRRSVIFGRNDLVQDAPISHVDLLVCRNTLMYFNAETQAKILGRLRFALNAEGVLFLGKAELLLSHSSTFVPVEVRRRFFRKLPNTGRRESRSAEGIGGLEPLALADPHRIRELALMSSPAAQVVLDTTGRLSMSNHRAEVLFGIGMRDVGRPFQDLEISYRPVELRSVIDEATASGRPVWAREMNWRRVGSDPKIFDIQVVPLATENGAPVGVTVIFNDVTHYRQLQSELEFANRQLESAYHELQSSNEELETTNEELQSTVEELETTNEELQSSNEELETMNEELQSMNDELHSSNEQLRSRTDQVAGLNQFLEGVLTSLRAGVAVVDPAQRVLAWNRSAADLWGVRADEAIGQSLSDLDIGLPVDALRPALRRILEGGAVDEQGLILDAVNRRGRTVQVRTAVSPLLGANEAITGAIILMEVR
jgi:two-component system, chemotaxis family, CheB/CheR fusion protein